MVMPLFASIKSKWRFDRTWPRMKRFFWRLNSVAAAALTAEPAGQAVAELLLRVVLSFAARRLGSFGASFDFGFGIRDEAWTPRGRWAVGIRDLADGVLVLCDAYSSIDFILLNAAWWIRAKFGVWPGRRGREEDGVDETATPPAFGGAGFGLAFDKFATSRTARSVSPFSFSCSAGSTDCLMNLMTRAFFGFPLQVKPSSLAKSRR